MKYTPEQLEFLRAGWKHMGLPELTEAFNAAFDLRKFPCQIRSTLKNHRFLSGRDGRFKKGERVLERVHDFYEAAYERQ